MTTNGDTMTTAVIYYPGSGGTKIRLFPDKHKALAFVETDPSEIRYTPESKQRYVESRRAYIRAFLEGHNTSLNYHGCELTTDVELENK